MRGHETGGVSDPYKVVVALREPTKSVEKAPRQRSVPASGMRLVQDHNLVSLLSLQGLRLPISLLGGSKPRALPTYDTDYS